MRALGNFDDILPTHFPFRLILEQASQQGFDECEKLVLGQVII